MPESNLQIQVERTPEGHFVKGQSGNPGRQATGVPEPRVAHRRDIAGRRSRGADPEGHGIRP